MSTILWHVTKTTDDLASFYNNGAMSDFGKGLGGQTGGLFLWSSKISAQSQIRFFSFKQNFHGLMVGVKADKISPQNWQIDFETGDIESAFFLPQLWKPYKDIFNQKANELNLPFIRQDEPCLLKQIQMDNSPFPEITVSYQDSNGTHQTENFSSTMNTANTGLCEAIHTWLYQESKTYQKAYQKLLSDIVKTKEISWETPHGKTRRNGMYFPLKYQGKTPLPVSRVFHVHCHKNTQIHENLIYENGKKQVCPFIRLYQSKKMLDKER